jgi:hypothetical protein
MLLLNGDVPNWEWFKETNDPVGNYRTYLLAKLYNRYAILFTDDHHKEMAEEGKETKVIKVQSNYDVLGQDFYGSIRWNHFEKLRKFLEESNIDPAIWLSAQFNRAIFNVASGKTGKTLPFPNALYGDTAYAYYKEYSKYHKKGQVYQWSKEIPYLYATDFVVNAINEAYQTADKGRGLLQYTGAIKDFLNKRNPDEKSQSLFHFYTMTKENMRDRNARTKDTIKKYLVVQSLISMSGAASLPKQLIIGSELTRVTVASIKKQTQSLEEVYHVLGKMVHPINFTKEQQMERGMKYYNQLELLDETWSVLKLINERKNLHLSYADVWAAFKDYGTEKIPVNDYSMLDTEQILSFMRGLGVIKKPEAIDLSQFTEPDTTGKWEYYDCGVYYKEDEITKQLKIF